MADPTTYGLFGTRFEASFPRWTATAAGQVGAALTGSDGQWLQGDLGLGTGTRIGPVGLRADLAAFGLHYVDPFTYDASGIELRPVLATPAGPLVLSLRPRLTVGAWSTDLVEGDLRVVGGDLEAAHIRGAFTARLSAGAVRADNGTTEGTFSGAEASLAWGRGRWDAVASLRVQRSPLETEAGGGVTVVASLRPGVQLQIHAGRTLRDPLFGTEGTTALSAGLSIRPVAWSPAPPAPVVAVGEWRDPGRQVVFTIRAPEAETVALTGDFTDWEPVTMERAGERWTLTRTLPPGLYHFGFLVDGSWALPPDAPGVVDDGWGRRNASVVVEPGGGP